jgi:hypothetical protein
MVANLNTVVIYGGFLIWENVGTAVNYHGILVTLGPRANVMRIAKFINSNFMAIFLGLKYCGNSHP